MVSSRRQICPLCEACCGLEVRVEDGQVVSIRGDQADVLSGGYVCPKGASLKDLHEDPDRLRTPLIRRGREWVAASWDEAFAEIARRLLPVREQHGPNSIGLALGNPSGHKPGLMLYTPQLIKAAGTRNVFTAMTLDSMPRHLASGLVFGHWMTVPVPDIDRSDYLLILGANPMVSNGSLWTVPDYRGRAKALRARGGRIVVIDPRRTETAMAADEHHFIRPGGDVFLLAAMVHVLFRDDLVALGRLAPHVGGLAALREATQGCTPEAASARCGIDAAVIEGLARTLAAARSGSVYGRMGLCTQTHGTLCSWLVDCLNVLTGKLDAPGGAMFPKAPSFAANTRGQPGAGRGIVSGRFASRVSGAPEVFGELPFTALAEEIDTPGDGQVRALITVASNPALSVPNGRRLARALGGLDFMLSIDIYLNETTRHADVILPGLSPLESAHFDILYPQLSVRNQARYSPAVFEPSPGQLHEWEILLRLGGLLSGRGMDADLASLDDEVAAAMLAQVARGAVVPPAEASTYRGPDRLLDIGLQHGPYGPSRAESATGLSLDAVRAAPGGVDLGPLQPRIPEVLRTADGMINLAPGALIGGLVAATGEPPEGPGLQLIGRRDTRSNNSWMHNLPTLAKGPPRFSLFMHPEDARQRGLVDADEAVVSSAFGSVTAPVQITDAVMPGVVSLPHGWGHDHGGTRLAVATRRPGGNVNALLNDAHRDGLSGNAVLTGIAVRVSRALQNTESTH